MNNFNLMKGCICKIFNHLENTENKSNFPTKCTTKREDFLFSKAYVYSKLAVDVNVNLYKKKVPKFSSFCHINYYWC